MRPFTYYVSQISVIFDPFNLKNSKFLIIRNIELFRLLIQAENIEFSLPIRRVIKASLSINSVMEIHVPHLEYFDIL